MRREILREERSKRSIRLNALGVIGMLCFLAVVLSLFFEIGGIGWWVFNIALVFYGLVMLRYIISATDSLLVIEEHQVYWDSFLGVPPSIKIPVSSIKEMQLLTPVDAERGDCPDIILILECGREVLLPVNETGGIRNASMVIEAILEVAPHVERPERTSAILRRRNNFIFLLFGRWWEKHRCR